MAENIDKQVAELLLQIKAIKLSPQKPFTWASGILSPIYCDNRVLLSYPAIRNTVKNAFVEKSAAFADFDVVAGVATAGIPMGALLADALQKPFVYVRAKAKEHGRQNLIEGELQPGKKVLVVEDLISTGGSSLKAVEAIRENGCEVVGVLAIFSYQFEEAESAFKNADCPMLTLSNYSALITAALESNYINQAEVELLQSWRKNPQSWKKEEFIR
ncbi:MAG TPA: orotate phosphoribosyltransferase [Saprospiraceae bacterium]|nr:orotate phosphoribosyltransferase [Saprospiraceae bacterium]